MMGWVRKHICDLAGEFRAISANASLTADQRKLFAEAYNFSKPYTSMPEAGGICIVTAIISLGCIACQSAFKHTCNGRNGWEQRCQLMQNLHSPGAVPGDKAVFCVDGDLLGSEVKPGQVGQIISDQNRISS